MNNAHLAHDYLSQKSNIGKQRIGGYSYNSRINSDASPAGPSCTTSGTRTAGWNTTAVDEAPVIIKRCYTQTSERASSVPLC